MTRRTIFRVCLLSGLTACTQLHAHHSVSAHFDMSRSIEIRGTVVDFKLRSPHASMIVDGQSYVDGVLQDESVQRWEIESSAAPGLLAMGMTRDTFQPGDPITVVAAPNRQAGFRFVNSSTFIDVNDQVYSRAGTAPYRPGSTQSLAGLSGVEQMTGRWRAPGAFARDSSPLPLNARGQAAWQNYQARLSPANTCEAMNIPDIFNAPYLFDVQVEDNAVTIHNQPWEVERTVPLNGQPVVSQPDGAFGVITGRVEGETIVLESRDFPPSLWGLGSATQLLGSGADVPSSSQKIVSERFSLSEDRQTLVYEYTLSDPVYLEEPFSSRLEFPRVADDTPMYPYVCEEESASMFSRTPEDQGLRIGE